eukprot:10288336-Alexandrium_andersonii.AAC.1
MHAWTPAIRSMCRGIPVATPFCDSLRALSTREPSGVEPEHHAHRPPRSPHGLPGLERQMQVGPTQALGTGR